MIKKVLKSLYNIHIPTWLFFLLLAVLILRIPSFFEPYYYGDEMIYLTLGEGIRQGVTLYQSLHDNKPPLIYILAAVAGSLFWFKVILAGWMVTSIIIFWKFVEKLYPKREKLHIVSTTIFALLTTLPLFEGNIVNAELFLIGPTLLAFYLLLFKKKSIKNLASAGALFSVATLFKVPAIFDIGAIVAFWFIYTKYTKKELTTTIKNLFFVFLGFITPILFSFLYYFFKGALHDYVIAAFLQNLGYLSTWKDQATKQAPFLIKNSALLIRFGILLLGNLVLYLKRKSLPKEFVFISSWILFSSFAIALSERPYPHYFIQVLAPVSILFGLFFTDKTIVQVLSIIPLTIAFFVPFYYKFWYYPTSSYYLRFAKLATKQISKDDYLNSFNTNLTRNYEIADQVVSITSKNERIFVWADTSQLYALTRRLPAIKYTSDYHISEFSSKKEVVDRLYQNPPAAVIILPEASSFPELRLFLGNKYFLFTQTKGAEIWKRLSL